MAGPSQSQMWVSVEVRRVAGQVILSPTVLLAADETFGSLLEKLEDFRDETVQKATISRSDTLQSVHSVPLDAPVTVVRDLVILLLASLFYILY